MSDTPEVPKLAYKSSSQWLNTLRGIRCAKGQCLILPVFLTSFTSWLHRTATCLHLSLGPNTGIFEVKNKWRFSSEVESSSQTGHQNASVGTETRKTNGESTAKPNEVNIWYPSDLDKENISSGSQHNHRKTHRSVQQYHQWNHLQEMHFTLCKIVCYLTRYLQNMHNCNFTGFCDGDRLVCLLLIRNLIFKYGQLSPNRFPCLRCLSPITVWL